MPVPNLPQQQAAPQSVPQQPQSNDEAISAFSKGLFKELDSGGEEAPNPRNAQQPQEETGTQDPQDPQQTPETDETQQPQLEAETPAQETEVPMVEVDVDGVKYQVPEAVKHRVMADRDYRQKTQEVAAERKQLQAFTATARQLVEQAQQMAPYNAHLFQLDNHANFLNQRLQSPELANDPLEFNRVQGELAITLRNRDQFAQGLQGFSSHLQQQRTQLLAQQWAQESPALLKEFPEFSKPEVRQKVAALVHEAGLPPEAVEFLNFSAAGMRLVIKAFERDQMVADQAKTKAKLQQKVKGAPTASQSSRAADPGASTRQLESGWKADGGKISDPKLTQLLRARLGRK